MVNENSPGKKSTCLFSLTFWFVEMFIDFLMFFQIFNDCFWIFGFSSFRFFHFLVFWNVGVFSVYWIIGFSLFILPLTSIEGRICFIFSTRTRSPNVTAAILLGCVTTMRISSPLSWASCGSTTKTCPMEVRNWRTTNGVEICSDIPRVKKWICQRRADMW